MVNDNFGFFSVGGRSYSVNFPQHNAARPSTSCSASTTMTSRWFLHQRARQQPRLRVQHPQPPLHPGARAGAPAARPPSLTAAAINNDGDVRFYAKGSQTDAFLRLHNGRFITLAVPARR